MTDGLARPLGATPAASTSARAFVLLTLFALALAAPARAQKKAAAARANLPSPDKIISDYVKAAGGKKRLASIGDATYEWSVVAAALESAPAAQSSAAVQPPPYVADLSGARAETRTKSPSSFFGSARLQGVEFGWGTTARAAWVRGADGVVRTLTDERAKTARLRAALEASKALDYKRLNLSAVTVGTATEGGEQAYVVEFRSRDGAALRYLFGASSKLPVAVKDREGHALARYSDYRAENGINEPHRAELQLEGGGSVALSLKSARYNTGFAPGVFDAPRAEGIDAQSLVKEVIAREPATQVKFEDYTCTIKQTERELNDKGETTKESSKVYEIYMTPAGQAVGKLVEEDGRPLKPAEAAKQEKQVADYLAAHENDKPDPNRLKGAGGFHFRVGDYGFGLDDLMRASEFVSPRRETFQGRESIVFDYRARTDFQPKTKNDEVLKKIVGLIWIDASDKVVTRIEARLTGDFKIGGGFVMNVKGAGFVFERARLADGHWVPRFFQWNANGKGFLVMQRSVYETTEWTNYKRFRTDSDDAKLDAPKQP
ncbi:MAG: hypothetical protein M3268_10320 [Acidobacteriota bacterium]|nr:hypothetical protein [Acidobacteriota bacterium]